MTWIMGVNSIAARSILVSDVQVTFTKASGEKDYRDCLQKVYPLGKFIVGGFAGSGRIGFNSLAILNREVAREAEGAWDLNVVANTWGRRLLARVFRFSSEREKKCG